MLNEELLEKVDNAINDAFVRWADSLADVHRLEGGKDFDSEHQHFEPNDIVDIFIEKRVVLALNHHLLPRSIMPGD